MDYQHMTQRNKCMMNPTHRFETPESAPTDDVAPAWSIERETSFKWVAIRDDTVYTGFEGNTIALGLDGTPQWVIDDGDTHPPALGKDTIYIRHLNYTKDEPELLRAHSTESRAVEWVQQLDGFIRAPCLVDETLYVATVESVFAIDAEAGDIIWHRDIRGEWTAVADGVVFTVPYIGWKLQALDAQTGEDIWTASNDMSLKSPTIVDGTLYGVGAGGEEDEFLNRFFAIDVATGEIEWAIDGLGSGGHPPAVVDGTVYAMDGGDLCALEADSGDILWRYETDSVSESSPLVVDDTVYFANLDGYVYALDTADGTERWTFETDGKVYAGPVATDGKLFVSGGSNFYALEEA